LFIISDLALSVNLFKGQIPVTTESLPQLMLGTDTHFPVSNPLDVQEVPHRDVIGRNILAA
jgi:hypothetical protein